MGVVCGKSGSTVRRVIQLSMKYPHYHTVDDSLKRRGILDEAIISAENKLSEHIKVFTRYKEEILKSNIPLYKTLFEEDMSKIELEVRDIRQEDEKKFMFFINKRNVENLKMLECSVTFPDFNFQLFPNFDERESTLKVLTINGSTVKFSEKPSKYILLRDLTSLDLSFNGLESISDKLNNLSSLTLLNLRRNNISSIPVSLIEIDGLTQLNLSENKFRSIIPSIFKMKNLETLDLSKNMIEEIQFYITDIKSSNLKYLYLNFNNLTTVSNEYIQFPKLCHVALDNNKITEAVKVKGESRNLTITLTGNPLKKKEDYISYLVPVEQEMAIKNQQSDEKPNENIRAVSRKPSQSNLKQNETPRAVSRKASQYNVKPNETPRAVSRKASQYNVKPNENIRAVSKKTTQYNVKPNDTPRAVSRKPSQSNLIPNENPPEKTPKSEEATFENIIREEKIKSSHNFLEIRIGNKLDAAYLNIDKKKFKDHELRAEIYKKRLEIIYLELDVIIKSKQEAEIAKFVDVGLRQDIKFCYNIMNKLKTSKSLGIEPELSQIERSVHESIIKVNFGRIIFDKHLTKDKLNPQSIGLFMSRIAEQAITNKDDMNNLKYLKDLKFCLLDSKVKLYLRYLSNIDSSIKENIVNLIKEKDSNSLILIMMELKLFLVEMIDYYTENFSYSIDVTFKYSLENTTNVIYQIFKNTYMIRILYKLGLKEIKVKNIEFAIFEIPSAINEKHKYMNNFINRFLRVIRLHPKDLESLI